MYSKTAQKDFVLTGVFAKLRRLSADLLYAQQGSDYYVHNQLRRVSTIPLTRRSWQAPTDCPACSC
jgi:hypothetical protein